VGRENSGTGTVASECEAGRSRGKRKAPEQSQFARVLVVYILILRANDGGIERENEPNFRPAGKGRGARGEWRVAEALRDIVVNYVCRDREEGLWQFGMRSKPACRPMPNGGARVYAR